jgi:EAL domain-containing protein (putative c-di-GMP-specific phosphodiesterase class I)
MPVVPCGCCRVVQSHSLRATGSGESTDMATGSEHIDAAAEDVALDAELASAMGEGQFFLLYQPTIDLQTNAFVGVEALLRWRSPTRGEVSPDGFLPRLEATGRIVEVGRWVLRTACAHGAAWHAKGYRFSVSVNLSPVQLAQEALIDDVEQALDASGFDPSHLILEFSERTLQGGSAARGLFDRLKQVGVRLAIDDFGADPRGAAPLDGIPIDVVKIDRAFISGLNASEEGADRVRELIELGRTLNVQTVAQGVEDDDQRLRLLGQQVDVGQGFLFSVPHSDVEIDRFLENYAIFSGRPL